ncbi:hypothetical protein F6O75_02760 [Streptococcus suis]|uniref:Uncharacterized protein n=1 Tax=Streptococcus suis (strain BM407) TaxID=568814 RepID=A0A0H3MXK1_STRS4|nr:hypothetical protein SSUJS14_1960 [Streptococcus suis JS14]AER16114.1 hypothetical protein SSU12_1939 [Streptococcus suis SS12]AER45138.1 hypothetical protein SSUA7_1821 [Streptococcus suis A7]ARL70766.1 hypothetical protein B9H01_09620 [Streptococcus suis]CAR47484.1 hypothetical protein SSU1790 [Streptococcus suis P1/7]CAZ52588.1 hypothetical protein SSUSC84_1812 [Streptococcus suis SC84]CAZ56716.1 hypothetical protein SSUBM407_1860 [Streptococcus suis BM407]
MFYRRLEDANIVLYFPPSTIWKIVEGGLLLIFVEYYYFITMIGGMSFRILISKIKTIVMFAIR